MSNYNIMHLESIAAHQQIGIFEYQRGKLSIHAIS